MRRAVLVVAGVVYVAVVAGGLAAWYYAGPTAAVVACVLCISVGLMLPTKIARRDPVPTGLRNGGHDSARPMRRTVRHPLSPPSTSSGLPPWAAASPGA